MNTQSTIFKTVFGTLILLVFLLAPEHGWGQIIAWQFGSPASTGSEVTYNATTNNTNLNTSILSRGAGVNASALARAFSSTNYTASGNKTDAITNNKYFQFIISSKSGYKVSLSTLDVRLRRSSTGPNAYIWRYSTDGTNYTDIGSDISFTSTVDGVDQIQINLSGISALQNVQTGTTITFRLYSWGATAITGTFAIGRYAAGITTNSLAIGGTVDLVGGSGPTKLAVTTINGGSSPSANTPFNVVVQAQDASSVPANVTANTDFTLSLATGLGSLGGTLTGTIAAGTNSVTVTGVTYNTAETGVSITATRTSGDVLTPGTSSLFSVLAAADHLAFVNVPIYGMINTNLNTFTVEARRADNSVDANFPSNITVDKASGTGNLTGTTVKTPVAGVATFNNLQLDAAGTYTLTATTGSVTPATTGNIEILASLSYRSKTSGAWNLIGTWETGNGSFWFDALEVPTNPGRDVLIKNGHVVIVPVLYNTGACKNLTVENGATLYANASASSCFVYVYGDILNDGIIGGATDVIGFDIEGTSCQLSGSGSFIAARIAKFTATNSTTNFTINQNLTLTYTSASSAALRNGAALTTFNITLGTGKQLTVQNAKIDLTNCTFKMENNASLLDNGTITASTALNTTVERTINAWGDVLHGWHLLSSPVFAQVIDPAFTNTTPADYDFYCWWEPTNEWVNYKNVSGPDPVWGIANVLGSTIGDGKFIPGKGYLVEYAATSTKQFKDALNTGSINVTNLPINSGANKGWHLLGNPFPSALTWGTSAWSLNNINATAKIWQESSASYVDIPSGTGIIPAMNGFMVQVTDGFGGNNSLTIPAVARVHDATPWYKSTDPCIVLVANDLAGQTAQESIIRFDNTATSGFDPAFDSHFLPGYAPLFYSVAGNDDLSTNALPEIGGSVQIPFDFIKNDGVNFTIEAKSITDVFGPVILNDLKTNATQDLTVNPVYSFTSATGDNASRFLLTFSHVGIGDISKDNAFNMFSTNNTLFVVNNTGKNDGNIFVYNTMGQLMMQQNLTGGNLTKINLNVSTGYYLIKIITTNNAYSGKVFIN